MLHGLDLFFKCSWSQLSKVRCHNISGKHFRYQKDIIRKLFRISEGTFFRISKLALQYVVYVRNTNCFRFLKSVFHIYFRYRYRLSEKPFRFVMTLFLICLTATISTLWHWDSNTTRTIPEDFCICYHQNRKTNHIFLNAEA